MTAATRATAKKRARFLEELAKTGNVSLAAEAARVSRQTPYRWRDADPDFAKAWAEAEEAAADVLEAEARRRAVEGVDEPVFYQGEEVGTVRRYSDTLLIFLLKGARPEKYKERASHEVTGANGGPIEVASARERLAGRLAGLAARAGADSGPGGTDRAGS